jgi:hypothetical protein
MSAIRLIAAGCGTAVVVQQKRPLYSITVGAAEQRDREGEAERLCCLSLMISSIFVSCCTVGRRAFPP